MTRNETRVQAKLQSSCQWRIQKILVGEDLKHKTSKIRMSSPKLRVIFRPKSEIQTFFSPKFRWSPKKKIFTKIESDFSAEIGNSNVFFAQNQVVTKKKKKKKKKGLHQNWDWFFAGFVTFRSVGGDASRNGAELFETEADFSAKIVTFRLVGGMHPPHPPPKSATGSCPILALQMFLQLFWSPCDRSFWVKGCTQCYYFEIVECCTNKWEFFWQSFKQLLKKVCLFAFAIWRCC